MWKRRARHIEPLHNAQVRLVKHRLHIWDHERTILEDLGLLDLFGNFPALKVCIVTCLDYLLASSGATIDCRQHEWRMRHALACLTILREYVDAIGTADLASNLIRS